jgi:hypothetical protein
MGNEIVQADDISHGNLSGYSRIKMPDRWDSDRAFKDINGIS